MLASLTHQLVDTALIWAKGIAPIAEGAARSLGKPMRIRRETPPTPLTDHNRSVRRQSFAFAQGWRSLRSSSIPNSLETPVTDRLVVACGVTAKGPWQLTAYRAGPEGQLWTREGFEYDVGTAWCLDLDGPVVEDAGDPHTERANACTSGGQGYAIEPIGGVSRHPEFDGDQALVYGEISSDVVSLNVNRHSGQRVAASIVRAPAEWDDLVDYFFAFVSGQGR